LETVVRTISQQKSLSDLAEKGVPHFETVLARSASSMGEKRLLQSSKVENCQRHLMSEMHTLRPEPGHQDQVPGKLKILAQQERVNQ
jgi:hypothetical protein